MNPLNRKTIISKLSCRLVAMAVCLCAMTGAFAEGIPPGRLIPSSEPGWPQFRGPGRDGISAETGLLKAWPEAGPTLAWKVQGIGGGYSSPVISDDLVVITGDVDDDFVLSAFNRQGELAWTVTNGASWKRSYPGARSTCAFSDGLLYSMNAHGRVACFDPADGREVWAVDTLERFEAENITWGISECLLIDGDRVIVSPGGKKAMVAALNKKTGETVWSSEPLRFLRRARFGGAVVDPPQEDHDKAGYASPLLFEFGGLRLLAGVAANHYTCVHADTGEILWRQHVPQRHEVIGAMPVFANDSIYFSSPDEPGTGRFRLTVSDGRLSVEPVWENPIDNCHGGFIHINGRLYGSGYRQFRGWACLDAETGETLFTREDLANGSAVYADERLYVFGEDGVAALAALEDDRFEITGRFPLVARTRGDGWAHPVVFDGHLYLRYGDEMFCFDVRDSESE